jgi:nicotinamidase-related amidase
VPVVAEGVRGLGPGRRAALVVSECQRGVLDPALAVFPGLAEEAGRRGILARIAALAAAARAAGHPVVHVHVAHRPDFAGLAVTHPLAARIVREGRMVAGTPEVEAMPAAAPAPADHVSSRHSGMGMWYGTDLDAHLRNRRVETVVLCGVSTNVALFAGALGAVDRGYGAVLVEDASAGATAAAHEWMVANTLGLLATLASTDAVLAAL